MSFDDSLMLASPPQGLPYGGKSAPKGDSPRLIGRTKGGPNFKLHAGCDGHERPVLLLLAEGQVRDYSGFVSAIPQLGLSLGIRSVPMISLGIMQYILPTTVFLLGVFVMCEPIPAIKLVVFLFIWTGVVLFLSGGAFSFRKTKSD